MAFYSKTREYVVSTNSSSGKMAAMHYHDSYELYYLSQGSREYFIEDKLFHVAAGDFVLISPGKLHRTGGDYGTRILVNFTEDFLLRHYSPQMIGTLLQCFAHMKLVPEEGCRQRCNTLLLELSHSEDEAEFALILGLLLKELSKCHAEELKDEFVGTIVAYINRNYAKITTLDTIADDFFVSKYHLCRIFKSAMKVTVIDYLNQIRIKNARQELEFSDRDIAEIATASGFHSSSYFCNLFRKLMGESPSEYRKKQRRENNANNQA